MKERIHSVLSAFLKLSIFALIGLPVMDVFADRELAYVWPSVDGTQVRLHDVQRKTHRPLLKLSKRVPLSQRIGHRLDWNPRGSELAFDSGHESARSLFLRDIYTVEAQSRRIRRITNAPDPRDFRRLPKGNVVVDVRHFSSGDLSVFVQGARRPVNFTARGSNTIRVTLRGVADFGKRARQYVRVFDHNPGFSNACWFDVGVFADVVPGKTVYAGRIDPLLNDYTCPRAFHPSWTSDGRSMIFVLDEANRSVSKHHVYQTPSRPKTRLAGGNSQLKAVYQDAEILGTYRLFAAFISPLRGRSRNEMLMLDYQGVADTQVYFKDIAKPDRRTNISSLLPCDDNRSRCRTLSLDFLPDGSSFVIARYEQADFGSSGPDHAVLYEFNPQSRRLRTILDIPGAAIGEVSVSSDGSKIAFARSSGMDPDAFVNNHGERLLCPCDVWTVNRDGTGLRRVRPNARTPSWRPRS